VRNIDANFDWEKIKAEYISSSISTRDLAQKYGISYGTLRDRAQKEKWPEQRKKYRNRTVAKTVQKTSDRISSRIAKELEKEYFIADKLADVLASAVKNKQQFNRHLVQVKYKHGFDEIQQVEEKIFDKVDMKAVSDAVKSLQGIEDIKRRIQGILTEPEKKRIDIENKKLALDREKANANKDDKDKVFKVIDPFVGIEGADDDNG
jgi:uncharacterized protein YjcR